MRYKIFDGDTQINTIVADEAFVRRYCASKGYTYELENLPLPEPVPEPEEEPSVWDELDAAYTEGVNAAYDQ